MKKFTMSALAAFSLTFTTPVVQSAEWYGFCYGKKSGEVLCAPIEKKVSDFADKCKTWAKSQGANVWGNHTGTSTEQLKDKQKVKCDKVLGAPLIDIPPIVLPIFSNYQCLGIRTCPGADGTTSSTSAEVFGTVSAISRSKAISLCIKNYDQEYLDGLEEASQDPQCHFKADVSKE